MKTTRAAALLFTLILGSQVALSGENNGQDMKQVVRVEEDWAVYILRPDAETSAPQITNVIAPSASMKSAFGLFQINHRSEPTFQNGGIQVQSWLGDKRNDFQNAWKSNSLDKVRDKLEYTVVMETDEQKVTFSLKNGNSRTWGKFPESELKAVAPASGVTLEEYDPQFSVDNTFANVGAHRVGFMAQYRVRYYAKDGLVRTDRTLRLPHRFQRTVEFVSLEEYEKKEEFFNIEITE